MNPRASMSRSRSPLPPPWPVPSKRERRACASRPSTLPCIGVRKGSSRRRLRAEMTRRFAKIAEIIRAVDPDVIVLNELDYGAGNDRAFVESYLDGTYPYGFIAPSNTGLATGLDLDGDGVAGGEAGTFERARDSHGFGVFEGQYGMAVLSKHPIDTGAVRTFRTFRWKDMPGARLPERPGGAPFYSDEVLAILRLSSKSHWDVPVRIGAATVHLLASHPDAPRLRRTGRPERHPERGRDPVLGRLRRRREDYILDDAGAVRAGSSAGAHFVIAGDLNADPVDGESVPGLPRNSSLEHPLVNASVTPASEGAAAAAVAQGGANDQAPRGPAPRHRRLPRSRARQPAGGLRPPVGDARDCRLRGVLAGRGRARGGARRRLRPPSRLGRRHRSGLRAAAVLITAIRRRLILASGPWGRRP